MTQERSESGDPIYRYDDKEREWEIPDMDDSSMELIEKHFETHVGKIDKVWHEILSDKVHIDVFQIAPTKERPCWTLFTTGMSDRPMKAPEGAEDWSYAELMICLPPDWKTDDDEFKKEKYYWPVRWLKMMARFPHDYETWFSYGHTMPNGDPAEPFSDDIDFSCMLLLRPMTVSVDLWDLEVRADKTIHFFALFPLYEEETNLKLQKGADHLAELFEKNKITELFDPNRVNVAKKRKWKLW
jgi:hypothetical protein